MNHALLTDELPLNRQLRFRVNGRALHMVRTKGESPEAFYLRLLAYCLYADKPDLEQQVAWHGKYPPDWACVDLKGTVTFYLCTRTFSWDDLLHVLRHHSTAEVALVRILDCNWDDDELVDALNHEMRQIRRHIHYRYANGRLSVTYLRPLAEWFDPGDLTIPEHALRTLRF